MAKTTAKKASKRPRKTTTSKPATSQVRAKHDGIPRTAALAKKHGFKKVKVDHSSLSARELAKWIPISSAAAKPGALAMVRPPTAGRPPFQVSPGDREGYYVVCYYDSATNQYDLNCVQVPASEIDGLRRKPG